LYLVPLFLTKLNPLQKRAFVFIAACLCTVNAMAQYWQQQVDYIIEVSLNTRDKTLDGFEKLTYHNNSPDTLSFIWFHLWPNAYKNDRTAFSDQMLRNGNTKFYFANKEERGYINRLDFKVGGVTARTEDHPQHIDIVKVLLPAPLPPGAQATITTPFHVKLPYNFSRGGYDGQSFQVTQWYPKPAVYDARGWHPMPYLDQGEFYSEFGSFDVRITVPKTYVVAATGELQNAEEKQWLKTRTADVVKQPTAHATQKTKAPVASSKSPATRRSTAPTTKPAAIPAPPVETKTLQYLQKNVHDFAWFAARDFIVESDTCQLPSGKVIEAYSYYTPREQKTWKKSLSYLKDAVRFYSREVGEYPYPTVSVVQGPESFGGGMEYPTITIISPMPDPRTLDLVIAHEVGHNWFYGILASNERMHPWMDEGINSYYEQQYEQYKYGKTYHEEELLFQTLVQKSEDQPIASTAEEFTSENYGLVAYYKTSQWIRLIEQALGAERFKTLMQQYYEQWKFKHPQPQDFKNIFYPALDNKGDKIFKLLNERGPLPNKRALGVSILSPIKPSSFSAYVKEPTKNALLLSPAVGYNNYDKLMIGGLITNYKLPPSRIQFIGVPLYATGSKSLTGIGRVSYNTFSANKLHKTEVFLNGATFNYNDFTDGAGKKHTARFTRLVPGAEITFRPSDPHATSKTVIQWKSYFIGEQPFRFSFDSVFTNDDTIVNEVVRTQKLSYSVHQLKLGIENDRALYPYAAALTAQGSQYFLRLSFEGRYFFNYREGGLDLRLFAGKFFYDENERYPYGYYIDRFALNMSGPNGEEDYTYSNYFLGRSEFEGFASRQLVERDGGFKIRTDLLANKVGKTGDWLMAANFNTTVPDRLNPLSILPIKIPLRLFADIGTYAEAWDRDAEADRFLFDAGFHIPLFGELINFYFPVVYSPVFKDYVKSTYEKNRFFRTMTFSINFDKTLKQIERAVSL
jgi:hypothetical protein